MNYSENLDFLLSTQKIKSIQEITQNTFLVNYNPLIDYTICMEHGVDYLKALTDNKNNSNIEKNTTYKGYRFSLHRV